MRLWKHCASRFAGTKTKLPVSSENEFVTKGSREAAFSFEKKVYNFFSEPLVRKDFFGTFANPNGKTL